MFRSVKCRRKYHDLLLSGYVTGSFIHALAPKYSTGRVVGSTPHSGVSRDSVGTTTLLGTISEGLNHETCAMDQTTH
jgi:hypothetical protein